MIVENIAAARATEGIIKPDVLPVNGSGLYWVVGSAVVFGGTVVDERVVGFAVVGCVVVGRVVVGLVVVG